MNLFIDPRFFNILILVLFALAAVRWAVERNWPQAFYWFGALIINVAVTHMAAK